MTTVLIVGAGPTGLTLAVELARRGVPFRLIEAAEGPQRGSRGKGVQPRTIEVFESLGVADRVISNGRFAMPMRMVAPDGTETVRSGEPPELRGRPDVPYTTSLITPEWRIEEALRDRLAQLGGVVEFGAALTAFEQTDSGVTATIDKAGVDETVAVDWLVGADGGHSVVRKHSRIAFEGETREEVRMLVADVAVDGLDRDAWYMWSSAEGPVTLCPLPSTTIFQYQAGVGPGQKSVELSLANLQETLERRTGRTDLRLHEPEWATLWRANIRLVTSYRDRRVFLAGDAAHIHSPAGGQGMNTGIQDAYNLGWKLAAVAAGAAPALLDSYEAERRPVAAGVLTLSNARLAQAITDNALVGKRDASTLQLDVGYRGSALARDDRGDDDTLRAGDRAPDATELRTVDGTRRLFDLTREGAFTLIAFGAAPELAATPAGLRMLRVVAEPNGPGELADTAGNLAAAYGPTDRTLVLIRPDGYIGLISDAGDAASASAYLTGIGAGSFA
ncbi:FAD-dependent monooxygenase [Gryllotalpicola protaetiae]|uniref:FAD-dependent monooxygenase n=1 Tax=Gryllotalpicola protaetiae TaxID=2419771 RepID=UPI0013C4406E|nr:FAD-dependent monooxygenase [Gryllotalpicola protaetiae]